MVAQLNIQSPSHSEKPLAPCKILSNSGFCTVEIAQSPKTDESGDETTIQGRDLWLARLWDDFWKDFLFLRATAKKRPPEFATPTVVVSRATLNNGTNKP